MLNKLLQWARAGENRAILIDGGKIVLMEDGQSVDSEPIVGYFIDAAALMLWRRVVYTDA